MTNDNEKAAKCFSWKLIEEIQCSETPILPQYAPQMHKATKLAFLAGCAHKQKDLLKLLKKIANSNKYDKAIPIEDLKAFIKEQES